MSRAAHLLHGLPLEHRGERGDLVAHGGGLLEAQLHRVLLHLTWRPSSTSVSRPWRKRAALCTSRA